MGGHFAGIRATGTLDVQTGTLRISASYKNFNLLQRGDGYAFSQAAVAAAFQLSPLSGSFSQKESREGFRPPDPGCVAEGPKGVLMFTRRFLSV